MDFFPLQQASRNVVEIHMLIHRTNKAENRCFSYFCFALQMDSKRHKSSRCSNTLPGSLFCVEPPALQDWPVVYKQALHLKRSSKAKQQESRTTLLVPRVLSSGTVSGSATKAGQLFLTIFDGESKASRTPRGCLCSCPPCARIPALTKCMPPSHDVI